MLTSNRFSKDRIDFSVAMRTHLNLPFKNANIEAAFNENNSDI